MAIRKPSHIKIFRTWCYRWQFGRKQQLAFLQDTYALINDGVPVVQAMETMRKITRGVQRQVAENILNALSQGHLLADGLTAWFPSAAVEVVRAGENSGTLINALAAAAEAFSQQSNVISGVLSTTLYPLTVVVLALIVTVFIKDSVLASFIKIKPLNLWPNVGYHLYQMGDLTETWWWLIIIMILALIIGIFYLLRHYTGKFRYYIDHLPIFSLYRRAIAARFMQTLGMLITNGVVLKQGLAIMQRHAQPYLAWHLLLMEYRLSSGRENIADVLDTDLLDHDDMVRLKVIALGKGFEHALLSLGNQAAMRYRKIMTSTSKITGAIFLALGAIIAATIIIGIYTVGSMLAS